MATQCPKCKAENPDESKFCNECGLQLDSMDQMPVPPTQTIEAPREELTTGSTFAGRYQIIEEIGKGGMGKVYRALDKKLNEEVALKLIKPEIASDKKTLERFQNELKVARKIRHSNVGGMYELLEDKGLHYITMEYVSGEDLKSFIHRSGRLTISKAVNIANQICEGLTEAHKLGIIHRDLKPSNVMIDKDGNARIMDFGIARSLKGKGITGAGVMIGTPEYMSPEQVEGKDIDYRSDIYSLGVILFEMVTGRVPFEGDTPLAVAMKHKGEITKDPRELNPQTSEDLSRVIMRCLEKEKEKRYQSPGELRAELENIEKEIPTTERAAPERKPFTSKEITVQFSLRKLLIPAIVLSVFIAVILIIWKLLYQKESAPPLSEKPSLAVMYFENRSGIEDLDKILVDMLTTNMSRYQGLDVVSSQRLFDILKQIGKQDIETIDRTTATEVATKAGVETMLLGSIMKIGDKIVVNSYLTDVEGGTIIDSAQTEGSQIEEDIFDMVDKLTSEIGMKLGAAPEGKEDKLKIADVTTNSLEAYKYYQKGLHHLWRLSYNTAKKNFQAAIEIDSSFAMAYLWMAWAQARMGLVVSPFIDFTPFKKSLAQAKKHSQKATEKERLLIDIGIAYFNFEIEEMRTLCQKMIERYPNEKLGYFFLVNTFNISKETNFENMENAIEKNLELDPTDGLSYNLLAYTHVFLKNRAGIVSTINKYKAVQPDVFNPYHTGWEAHMMLGLFEEALPYLEEGLEKVPETHSWHWWLGLSYLMKQDTDKARKEFQNWYEYYPDATADHAQDLGLLYLVEGKYAKAVSEFRRGIEFLQKENNIEDKIFGHLSLGKILVLQSKYDEAIEEYKQAERLSKKLYKQDFNPYSIYVHYLMGLALVKKGDYEAAINQVDLIQSIIQEGNYSLLHSIFLNLLSAEIHVAQKNPEAVRTEMDKVPLIWIRMSSPHFLKLRVSLLQLQGNLEKAIEHYKSSFENWTPTNPSMRYFDLIDYFGERSKLDYRLAQMYEQLGDEAKAIEHYEKFIDLWKDADPGIAEVDDARERLAGAKSQ